jgi:hypothetical protein
MAIQKIKEDSIDPLENHQYSKKTPLTPSENQENSVTWLQEIL